MNLRHEITRLRTACAPLALCAVAALLTVFPLQAQAAKAWAALPSEISVFTGITPTATVTHAGSAFVIYAVISDLDYYIESPDNGPASDQCTYSWSTDSGFVTGGLLCTWALASDAKGLCTCQLIVDDVGAIWPPDTGDRNDKPVTRTFQVGVPTGAIAITKCDASAAGLHEINYTTTTYAATQQNLVLEYRENNSPYTSDWTAITTPPELLSTTTDAHSVVTKTFKVLWNTLSLHNSHYEVRMRATYYYPGLSETVYPETPSYGVNVGNLDITTAPAFLKLQPGGNIDTIEITQSDNKPQSSTFVIQIYNSDRSVSTSPVRTMTDSWTSNLSFIQWDGKNDSGQLCTPGIYVFKVTVSHTQDGGVDTVCDKSTTTLSSLSLSAVNSQGSTYTTNVYGSTSGSVDNGQMTIFKPDLNIAVTQSYNVASAQIGALVKTYSYAPSSICGDYRLFLCGDDNNLATDKSHRSRPILGASIVQRVYGLSFYFNNTVPTIKSAPYVSLNGTPINRSSGFYISTCGKAIGTSYVPQSLPDPDDADAIKSTLSYGSPTGYLSWSSPQAGVSPTLFVFYGHGESSRLLCSNNTYLTTSDIDTLPMPLDNNAGRLAILHACFTASGGSTSFAYHLHNRGWRVIAFSTEVPNTLLDRLEEVWMDHWSSHNFGMSSDELQTSFSDTKAQLGNEYPYPMPEHAVVLGLTLL